MECQGGCRKWFAILNREMGLYFLELVIFEQRLKGGEGKNNVGAWEKSIPDRGNSTCEVSEAGPRTQKPMRME